ncbi:MAG: alpha/beta hydrolase [Nocardioidaceae bacterium]
MSAPRVTDDRLSFSLHDPSRHFVAVTLDCDEAVESSRRFRRTASGWSLTIACPALTRLEYKLVVIARGGATHVICDPDNTERVTTAFGDRSVVLLPGYTTPWWLSIDAPPGRLTELVHRDPVIGDLPIQLWSPAELDEGTPAPLLVVHDGPEYVDLAGLAAYASALTSTGGLRAFRMALMTPLKRDEWYSANPAYVEATAGALRLVSSRVTFESNLVIMGASLGGLVALTVARALGGRCAGVFSQSGSFFTPMLDQQESAYPFFDRVVRAVATIASDGPSAHPHIVGMTCGALEENLGNNHALAKAMSQQGHDVRLRQVPDLHNYTAWRDSLDPGLTEVLRAVWSRRG